MTFSSTVSDENGFTTWNVRAIPRPLTRCGGSPRSGRPFSAALPSE